VTRRLPLKCLETFARLIMGNTLGWQNGGEGFGEKKEAQGKRQKANGHLIRSSLEWRQIKGAGTDASHSCVPCRRLGRRQDIVNS